MNTKMTLNAQTDYVVTVKIYTNAVINQVITNQTYLIEVAHPLKQVMCIEA